MEYGRYGRRADDEALCGSIRADGVSRDARLVELTLHGGAIETPMAVGARDEVRLMFVAPGGEPIVVDGIVRYVDDDRIGVEFVRMSDADRARYRALLLSEFERLDLAAQSPSTDSSDLPERRQATIPRVRFSRGPGAPSDEKPPRSEDGGACPAHAPSP